MDDEVQMLQVMFRDRDYKIDVSDIMSNPECKLGGGLMFYKEDDGVGIFYVNDEQVKPKIDMTFLLEILTFNLVKLVIVTDVIKAWQKEIEKILVTVNVKSIEIISHKFLLINPTDHYLVPRHVKATKKQRDTFADILRLNDDSIEDNVAQLEIVDPIARWYDYSVGDLIIITREYPIKEGPIYRVVSSIDYATVTKAYQAILL